ncbi:hypothetical protein BY996DRAFT_4140967 [Phakopsora pachyrhizi]|uniref:Expressed protein n=1 Tax=Phakopsora pachyrhizi TaxID=170000 RepID=A0AAV0BG08_PHAPC|nr:hypothetical protein BY996DRAFT_4140967 [Phakopsora pachyrhizi]CAH7686224.1 expressed protein [Phakopsora pachyrhizi]
MPFTLKEVTPLEDGASATWGKTCWIPHDVKQFLEWRLAQYVTDTPASVGLWVLGTILSVSGGYTPYQCVDKSLNRWVKKVYPILGSWNKPYFLICFRLKKQMGRFLKFGRLDQGVYLGMVELATALLLFDLSELLGPHQSITLCREVINHPPNYEFKGFCWHLFGALKPCNQDWFPMSGVSSPASGLTRGLNGGVIVHLNVNQDFWDHWLTVRGNDNGVSLPMLTWDANKNPGEIIQVNFKRLWFRVN